MVGIVVVIIFLICENILVFVIVGVRFVVFDSGDILFLKKVFEIIVFVV